MTEAAPISIIIPCRDSARHLERCLDSVRASRRQPLECIVVDDGSTDETARVARAAGARVVSLGEPRGPAYARNQGAAAAGGEYLLFLDSDVLLYPDTLEKVLAELRRDRGLDALIGSYDSRPEGGFAAQFEGLHHHYMHQTGPEYTTSFAGFCGLIRKSVFDATGGFSTEYSRPSVEDVAFGHRLTTAGGRIRLAKGVQVTHLKPWTLAKLIRTEIFDRAIPWTELILDGEGTARTLNLAASQYVSVALAFGGTMACLAYPLLGIGSAGAIAGLSVAVILVLNRRFYRFLARQRGLGFTLRAVPLHLLYFLYSGLGFLLGSAHWVWRRFAGRTVAGRRAWHTSR